MVKNAKVQNGRQLGIVHLLQEKKKKIRYATTEIEHGPTDLESDILTTLPSHRETINNAGSI